MKEPEYRRQYIITHADIQHAEIPAHFIKHEVNELLVYSSPELPFIQIKHETKTIGCILGTVIETDSCCMLNEGDSFNIGNEIIADVEQLEERIYKKLGGSFVFLINVKDKNLFFLDAGGSLGAIYKTDEKIIASTTSVIGIDKASKLFDKDLSEKVAGSFYSFGLLPFKGYNRLIPNHCIDIENWIVKRHYPGKAYFSHKKNKSTKQLITEIAANLKLQIKILVEQKNIFMSLTAGGDNRMTFSATKEYTDKIHYYINANSNKIDLFISDYFKNTFKLKHTVLPVRQSGNDEKEFFEKVSGYCAEKATVSFYPLHKTVVKDFDFIATGSGGEVGRCFYWRSEDENKTKLTAKNILTRMRLDKHFFEKPCQHWLDGLPEGITVFETLDLLFLEQQGGCRNYSDYVVFEEVGISAIAILNNRMVYENMLLLEPAEKKNNRIVKSICELNWAALNSVPLNNYPGLQGVPLSIKKELHKLYKNIFRN